MEGDGRLGAKILCKMTATVKDPFAKVFVATRLMESRRSFAAGLFETFETDFFLIFAELELLGMARELLDLICFFCDLTKC